MFTDSSGRRLRQVKVGKTDKAVSRRQPRKKKPREITERVIQLGVNLAICGGRLPTSILFALEFGAHANYRKFQDLLCDLFNENGLLYEDWRQRKTLDPRMNESFRDLTPAFEALLQERGRWSPYFPKRRGVSQYFHDAMGCCISAYWILSCHGTKYTYGPQHEVCGRAGRGIFMYLETYEEARTRFKAEYPELTEEELRVVIERKRRKRTPDRVFMLRSNSGLLIFEEDDRATEGYDKVEKIISDYNLMIGTGVYKTHFNVECRAMALIITTDPARQKTILELIAQQFPDGCSYISVTCIPEFGNEFHPPAYIDMIGREYARCGYPPIRFLNRS